MTDRNWKSSIKWMGVGYLSGTIWSIVVTQLEIALLGSNVKWSHTNILTDKNIFDNSYYVVSNEFPRFPALGEQKCLL